MDTVVSGVCILLYTGDHCLAFRAAVRNMRVRAMYLSI